MTYKQTSQQKYEREKTHHKEKTWDSLPDYVETVCSKHSLKLKVLSQCQHFRLVYLAKELAMFLVCKSDFFALFLFASFLSSVGTVYVFLFLGERGRDGYGLSCFSCTPNQPKY